MRLLRKLIRNSDASIAWATAAGVISGACNAAAVAWLSTVLSAGSVTLAATLTFVAVVAIKLASGFASRQLLARVSSRTLHDMQRELCARVVAARLLDVERFGTSRIMAVLTDDVSAIANALSGLPALAVNATVIVGCAIYLAWLSWPAFLATVLLISAGIAIYRALSRRAVAALSRARAEQDRLLSAFRTVTDGIVELKLHSDRRRAFLRDVLGAASAAAQREQLTAAHRFGVAHLFAQSVMYAALAGVLIGVGRPGIVDAHVLTGFVLTLVYLTGPLAAVLAAGPAITRADIALNRIDEVGRALPVAPAGERSATEPPFPLEWRRMQLEDITHQYDADGGFALGPLSLDIQRGEILFITGGNGSGKSTLAKVIAGLYEPASGTVRVDGREVTDANRDRYRDLFSSVLSPFFLFDALLGLQMPRLDARAQRLLERFELAGCVSVSDGRWSTTALSQGQRKRLALIAAALEGRSLYVLDEWAADQDAAFRHVFYRELLPELRRAGSTAIVISHDERFFDVADRIVRLERGQVDGLAAPALRHQRVMA